MNPAVLDVRVPRHAQLGQMKYGTGGMLPAHRTSSDPPRMHPDPPADTSQYRPHMGAARADLDQSTVDGIVGGAMAGTVAAPPPSGRDRRRLERMAAAQAKAMAPRGGAGGGSSTMRMFTWGLLALVALGGGAVATGAVQLGPPGGGPTDVAGGTARDGAWSYYHDTDYASGDGAAKWSTDRSRSSDPDEAVLGDTTRWEYDGPYRYGPYGSDGMRRRAAGRETVDPLYSQPAPTQDVFSQYGGDLDPSGGQPVGVAPSSMTTPYYDPYAGYANPYSNRIRMAYGEGIGRGASYVP